MDFSLTLSKSSSLSSIPPVSQSSASPLKVLKTRFLTSLVVPETSLMIASLKPKILLNSELLPTFGLPMIAIFFKSVIRFFGEMILSYALRRAKPVLTART